MKKALILLLLVAFADGGCSYLTSNGRQQAAYARYVRHSSYTRMKMQKKHWSRVKIPSQQMQSDPAIATSSGPESVTASGESPSQ
jgi:hypothetical protein